MIKTKIIRTISAVMCVVMLFSGVSIPVYGYNAQPDASVKRIKLYRQSGVLEGETLQLRVNIESDSTLFDGVEWSSSNPSAISCTADGKITGHTVGESATITCKARYGSAKDSINVVCVKKLEKSYKSSFNNLFTQVYSKTDPLVHKEYCFDAGAIVNPLLQAIFLVFRYFAVISSLNSVINSNVTVCGKAGSYAYIRYGENNLLDGFVKFTKLKNTGNAFLTLSAANMCVYADGVAYDSRKLTTNYDGNVTWTVEHENKYLEFVRETGQITGLVPGHKAVITATADGETATCTIHLLYKWPQNWTGKTNRKTYIYYADGNNYSKGMSLAQNTEFVVEGDCGTNSGWAYGYIKGTNNWGFIPISHISTKGTISQYNNMTTTIIENNEEKKVPWVWPVRNTKDKVPQNKKANYISSPYGWRETRPKNHQGIDITTGNAGEIAGYDVVPAFSGTVVFCGDEYGYDWGYCVAVRSDEVDPVSGLPYIAVYMHLMYAPNVSENQKVIAGETILGYVGKTTIPENQSKMGYHLHFEFNNQNSSISLSGESQISGYGRKSFDYLINPIFVYMDEYEEGEITYNPASEAENYKKTFWYGNGTKYEDAS